MPEIATPTPRSTFEFGLGAVSPLWPAFAFAATTGAAVWWMSRLTLGGFPGAAVNLEAAIKPMPPEPVVEPVAQTVAETVEPLVELAPKLEVVAAPEADAVIDPVVEAPVPVEAVAEPAPHAVAAKPVAKRPAAPRTAAKRMARKTSKT